MKNKRQIKNYLDEALTRIRVASRLIGPVTEDSTIETVDIAQDLSNSVESINSAIEAIKRSK